MKIKLNPYQAEFLASEKRFPALVAAIGTGKTFMLLLKIWTFCEKYPDTLALVVRKEFTDLRDSTMNDFENYFNVKINSSAKEYVFPNGSRILFRHGAELNVLKNLNLSIVGIEQAEEFESDETFDFLRDRLRRQTAPLRQLCIIANARGHNWVWQRWINNPPSSDYFATTATSFDNAHNLPADFIEDLKSMEKESPNHYKQYVMNSFEDLEEDDLLFTFEELEKAVKQEFLYESWKFTNKILAVDLARYGNDKCVAVLLQERGPQHWEEVEFEEWQHKDLMYSAGRIMDLRARYQALITVVDGDGLGAGVVDRLRENRIDVVEYRGGMNPMEKNKNLYTNKITEHSMFVKNLISQNRLKISSEVVNEAQTIRFFYDSKGRKGIVSKEKMRSEGVKSPDHWDALRMACSEIDNVGMAFIDMQNIRLPRYSKDTSPYAGMR